MQPFARGACQRALPEKPRWKLCWTEAGRLRIAPGRPSTSSAAALHDFMGLQIPDSHVPELGDTAEQHEEPAVAADPEENSSNMV